jgi:hypothetical protein
MGDPIQLLVLTGAAGAFLWVLKQIIDGKLHSSSETDGLRQDKVDLLRINGGLNDGLKASNAQLTEILILLRERLHVDAG